MLAFIKYDSNASLVEAKEIGRNGRYYVTQLIKVSDGAGAAYLVAVKSDSVGAGAWAIILMKMD